MSNSFNGKQKKTPQSGRKNSASASRGRTGKQSTYENVLQQIPKNVRKPLLIGIAVTAAVLLLFLLLNESFFHIEVVPTIGQLFDAAGLSSDNGENAPLPDGDTLQVHYIDVGQGDCQLVVTSSATVLIDCGEREYYERVIDYIKGLDISKLDYVVVSHPHTDHMGGMSYIIDEFDVGTVIMPKIQDSALPTTNAYKRLLTSISEKNIKVNYAEPGKKYGVGGAVMTVLSPVKDYDNLNNYSAAVRITHGENTFLFTGDIEKKAEADILSNGGDVSATVLKVAHHGSSGSSSKAFIDAVNPEYAVIGVGTGNDYGHPHKETLKWIEERKLKLYRTDLNGNVIFTSTGSSLTVKTEKG